MADDQRRGDGRPDRPHRGKPGKPYRGPPGGPARSGKPGQPGRPPGGPARGGKPYGGKPYGGKPRGGRPPGGRPYQGTPGGRPHDMREPRPGHEGGGPAPGAGDRPRPEAEGGGQGHGRRVEHGHRQRPQGPRPARGPWDRDRGQRRPRPERYPPPRPAGLSAAEVLGEDEEVVAGRRPVEEAFAARREAKRLLVVPERRAALDQLVLHATTLRIPVVEVEGGTITAVTGFDGHQGVALVVAPRRWATLDEVLALAKSRGEPPFLLALDHLEDPQNVGTLLRSAEACGVHGVIFPTRGAAPISPAAIKTSAGAVEHLLLVPMPDLAAGLVDLHARGVRVIGADGDAQMTVREADLRGPIVIVTGSEGRGLNARVRKRVDLMARIPMRGVVASLNASVAGSVFLFEAAAQRDLPEREPGAGEQAQSPPETTEAPPGEVAASEAPTATEPETAEAAEETAEAGGPAPEAAAPGAPVSPETPALEADDLLPEAPPPPEAERG